MATYKVLQDIEAEDKLVGPFSLRQFIYAGITILSCFIAFKLAYVSIFLTIPFIPVIALFGVLAAPIGGDQPSEVWLLAKIRFFLKPHRRIWNQDGVLNLVVITAPKIVQKRLTKDFTQTEAKSRLKSLANTVDSRGWAVKNVNINLSNQDQTAFYPDDSERLIDSATLPQDVPSYDVTAADDMLDSQSNPTAQHLNQMIIASDTAHKNSVIANMSNDTNHNENAANTNNQGEDYSWFMNNEAEVKAAAKIPENYAVFNTPAVVRPGAEEETTDNNSDFDNSSDSDLSDAEILDRIEKNKQKEESYHSRMHVVEPLSHKHSHSHSDKKPEETHPVAHIEKSHEPTHPATSSEPDKPNPDIINLALADKDNLSVATYERLSKKAEQEEPPDDEVVISLH